MIAAVHALLGSTLARCCGSRTQAALVGSASHPLADMAPHRDLEIPQEAVLLAGALCVIAAARGVGSREFAGAVGAVFPDVENLIGRICGIPGERLLLPTHSKYHGRETGDFHGQLAIVAVGLASLLLPDGRCEDDHERGTSSR
jgi:hypothetical protein